MKIRNKIQQQRMTLVLVQGQQKTNYRYAQVQKKIPSKNNALHIQQQVMTLVEVQQKTNKCKDKHTQN
jgi:hypothetical protein